MSEEEQIEDIILVAPYWNLNKETKAIAGVDDANISSSILEFKSLSPGP